MGESKNSNKCKKIVIIICFILAVIVLFSMLSFFDNKYNRVQPVGKCGTLSFSAEDINKPIFLIDGWMVSVNGEKPVETFIGQYANYTMGEKDKCPFGTGIYKLKLKSDDQLPIIAMKIPEMYSDYEMFLNGNKIAENGSGAVITFNMEKEANLKVIVKNDHHYYSGQFFPLAIGTSKAISKITFINYFSYMSICILAIIVGIFALLVTIGKERKKIYFHFAILGFSVVFVCAHPFIWILDINSQWFYALEDASRLVMIAEALFVASCIANIDKEHWVKRIYLSILIMAGIEGLSVGFILSRAESLVIPYMFLANVIAIVCCIFLTIVCTISLKKVKGIVSLWTVLASITLGIAILWNILDGSLYEPIYTLWPIEWAAFVILLMYSLAITNYNKMIVIENREIKEHLEELVEDRSKELHMIIEERKRFFSDMAHNLKSPITTIHGFISLIQQHQVGLDDELLGYIALIKSENLEMQKRVQALNVINQYDKIDEPKKLWNVNEILMEVEEFNRPSAEVQGVYLKVNRLPKEVNLLAQKEKILTMFENLIFNGISFTEPEGSVTVNGKIVGQNVLFSVKDTGSGISKDQLPYIFDRFYVGRENKDEGSGLGLYIVKLIVDELGGDISVKSELGKGTEFNISLPIV